jgi:hypothetical protein
MKKHTTVLGIVSGVLTLLLGYLIIREMSHISIQELSNSLVADGELYLLTYALLLIVSAMLFSEFVRKARSQGNFERGDNHEISWCRSILAWLSGILVMNTSGVITGNSSPSANHGVSADAALSPLAASAVLRHILRRRREQLRDRVIPDQFTTDEIDALSRICEVSDQDESVPRAETKFDFTPDVRTVLSAVERTIEESVEEIHADSHQPWLIELKLFGYPMAVTATGTIAEFRKKRSLELLTWLTLNRDRARRSTARTAMWDLDVSDATFSTVVSELRRALRDAVGEQDGCALLPATYSDDLPLSSLVITDFDRLKVAHAEFVKTNDFTEELRGLLQGIRDIPLAGTSYSWADLDGTTTRLVMSALSISTNIATVLVEQGNLESASIATMAGLRILPGCDELLEIQEECLHRAVR